ncbi:hypothetical protein BH23ACT3_BH23ACT3_05110 [soil metagenome]
MAGTVGPQNEIVVNGVSTRWHEQGTGFEVVMVHGIPTSPALSLRSFFRRGHDTTEMATEALEEHWPHYARHDGARAFLRQICSLDVDDTKRIADRLPTLDVPASMVWGTGDQFQKVDYGERLARDLGTELRRIDGAKHWTPEDHPHVIATAINDVLTRRDPG